MELFRWERNPWGQAYILGVSWDLFWVSVVASVVLLLGYTIYKWRRSPEQPAANGLLPPDVIEKIPERVVRHPLPSRLFHWIMAASMLALVVTGFFPVLGLQIPWVTPHWIAGLLLTISVIFHIIHASFWLDFKSIWPNRKDLADGRRGLMQVIGRGTEKPGKPGKYPLENKLFHLFTTVAGLAVIITGLLMMRRVDTPLWTRDPYFLGTMAKAVVYTTHGLAAVAFAGAIIGHIYFALRPEKLWITRSMIKGWITRKEYLEHHDVQRWRLPELSEGKAERRTPPGEAGEGAEVS